MIVPIVCYIASHGASCDHFATFIKATECPEVEIRVYAAKEMVKKFHDKNISIIREFTLNDEEESIRIAKECSNASLVLTDVGHSYSEIIQKQFAIYAPNVRRAAYYDNPEVYVPGGYSETAKKVLDAAQSILFANANLQKTTIYSAPNVPIDLSEKKVVGLGYYPISSAERILEKRTNEREAYRREFLSRYQIEDFGQKIYVYFGGNNEEYFEKAFPAYLAILEGAKNSCKDSIFLLQQHPAAKVKNRDANQIKERNLPTFLISDTSSDIAQIIADGALYFQTSMGPQFLLAGIPTAQIGHERYDDILIRSTLITSITTKDELINALQAFGEKKQNFENDTLFKGLGITCDWQSRLLHLYLGT